MLSGYAAQKHCTLGQFQGWCHSMAMLGDPLLNTVSFHETYEIRGSPEVLDTLTLASSIPVFWPNSSLLNVPKPIDRLREARWSTHICQFTKHNSLIQHFPYFINVAARRGNVIFMGRARTWRYINAD
jgi:hypothetical protein